MIVKPAYRGRFAPSPTGPLHLGSLVAALASYLQARVANGRWLLRIEDLDEPRNQVGAVDQILRSLEAHALFWDESVTYQHDRQDLYEAALNQLIQMERIFYCSCSRKMLQENYPYRKTYPGICRGQRHPHQKQLAMRLEVENRILSFQDLIQGPYMQNIADKVGDFVVKRADGTISYQLAVVVDDYEQGITEVVRGADLLDNTPRQLYLQELLSYTHPVYGHVPVVYNLVGQKLSKQTGALALYDKLAHQNLRQALSFLRHTPPEEIQTPAEILAWAVSTWNPDKLSKNNEDS